jgi:hypothetical protein
MKIKNDKIENNYKLKISLKINKLKYFPSEEINGFIIIQNYENNELIDKIKSYEIHIIFQEKILYYYSEKNSKTFILDKLSLKIKDYEIIEDKKYVRVPFKYKLPESSKENFYPSFRYFSNSIKCLITHFISIEIPTISNKNSINIFIRKIPKKLDYKINSKDLDKTIFKDEFIKNCLSLKKGRLSYLIKTKEYIFYKDKIPVEIHIDERDLGELKIESVNIKIIKHIYIYNNLHVYGNSLSTNYDIKNISLNKNIKNNVIIENFQLPETEFTPISLRDILKINYKSKYNFTPPLDNILFKCEYILHISFKFHSKLVKDKSIDIPLDFCDNINKNENASDKQLMTGDEINIDTEMEKILEGEGNDLIINNDQSFENEINFNNGFVQITKEDFINALDGKK